MTEPTTEPTAEAPHVKTYLVPVPGTDREIEMLPPTEAQVAIFSRVVGSIGTGESIEARGKMAMRNVGIIMQVIDLLVVDDADKTWLDYQIMTDVVSVPDAMGLIMAAAREHYGTEAENKAPTTGPVRIKR